jgi:dual specificity tyrosine-phosphorylation-regulated kinase 2/3/4
MLFNDSSAANLVEDQRILVKTQRKGSTRQQPEPSGSDLDVAKAEAQKSESVKTREQSKTDRPLCPSTNVNRGGQQTVFSFKSQVVQQEPPAFPMKPLDCLRHFGKRLSEYESREILEYPEIFFIGKPGCEKIQASSALEHNSGYDDEQGDYKYVEHDHIGYRYEVLQFLGKGSFGTALKCFDHKTNVEVAVKIVKNK